MKRQATDCETIFANHIFDKGLVSRIYKEPSKLNSFTIVQLKNRQKTCIDTSSEIYQMTNKCMKKYSILLTIRDT